jgi:hypothetical protein
MNNSVQSAKEIISDLLENNHTDTSLLNSFKEDLRELYILANQSKEYREDFNEDKRDSLGFTFRKLSSLLDAVGSNAVAG